MAMIAGSGATPLMCLRAGLVSLLCAMAAAAPATSSAQEGSDPRLGHWDERRISDDFDSLLQVFEPAGTGKIRLIVNAKLLEANRWHVDFSCDGSKYRMLTQGGKFTGITYSCHRTGPRSFEFASTRGPADPGVSTLGLRAGDWTIATGTETVSDEGKRYATTAVLSFADGHKQTRRHEFIRRE
jgi:hypothetical protein